MSVENLCGIENDPEMIELMLKIPDVEKAREFARYVHRNQFRKDGKTPYFLHLDSVARIAARILCSGPRTERTVVNVLSAAYLHDSAEDQEVPIFLISELFGQIISGLVNDLTNLPIPAQESVKEAKARKEFNNNRIAGAIYQTVLLKLSDRLHNLSDLDSLPFGLQLNMVKSTDDLLNKLSGSTGLRQVFEYFPESKNVVEEIKSLCTKVKLKCMY